MVLTTSPTMAPEQLAALSIHDGRSPRHRGSVTYSPGGGTVVSGFTVEAEDENGRRNNSTTQPRDIARPTTTQQHPHGTMKSDSPELLATSVGEGLGGQLVPSSSNISLLSLNTNNGVTVGSVSSNGPNSPVMNDPWHQNVQRNLNQQRFPSGVFQSGGAVHTPLANSRSGTPVALQPQAQTQPIPPPAPQQQKQQQQQQQPMQPMQPMQKSPRLSRPSAVAAMTGRSVNQSPESPDLGPVSASGSPSCFYLTDHSPPSSLQSSYFNLAMSQLNTRAHSGTSLAAIGAAPSGSAPRPTRLRMRPTLSQSSSLCESIGPNSPSGKGIPIGGKSPEFLPVSSTLPSMTPLELSIDTDGGATDGVHEVDPENETLAGSEGTAGSDSEHLNLESRDAENRNTKDPRDSHNCDGDRDGDRDGDHDGDHDDDVFGEHISERDL